MLRSCQRFEDDVPGLIKFVVGDEMIVTWVEKQENHQQEGEEEVIQSGFWFRTDFLMVFNADLLSPFSSSPFFLSLRFLSTIPRHHSQFAGDGSTILRPPCFYSPSKHVEDPTKRLKII